jgi:hypothetical protein
VSTTPPEASARPAPDIRQWLPILGVVVAVWGMMPKFWSPPLNTDDTVEIVDHVIPGIIVLLVSLACLAVRRSPNRGGLIPFFSGMTVLLAGFWMVATHVPLVGEALSDEAPWDATIYHTSAAMAVFGLGLLWCTTHWSDLAAAEAAQEAAKAEKAPGAGKAGKAGKAPKAGKSEH